MKTTNGKEPMKGVRRAWMTIPLGLALVLAGCRDAEPYAYGSFEASEVTVSAEVGGHLVRFDVDEGVRLPQGSDVGQIDTVPVALQLAELRAQRAANAAQTEQSREQTGALEAQLRLAEREYARTLRLYEAEAATEQRLEQTASQVEVLRAQIRAARQQTSGSVEVTGASEARIAQFEDRLDRSQIRNPVGGTVLTTYVRAGELVQPGQPLYKVADLDTLELRAYVSGSQLARIRVGDAVEVRYDAGPGEIRALPGRLTWISPAAEFTPTPIQTREERADLVYAVRVRVPNPDGVLKIGMPGELHVDESASDPREPS